MNGMQLPERLIHTFTGKKHGGPTAVVIDLAPGLHSHLVLPNLSSYAAVSFLSNAGAQVNPLIIPAFAHGADSTGAYAAALVHMIIKATESFGLLALHESDAFSVVNESTEKTAELICGSTEFETTSKRVLFLINQYVEAAPMSHELDVHGKVSVDFEDLRSEFAQNSEDKNGNKLYIYVMSVDYNKHDSDGAQRAAIASSSTTAHEDDETVLLGLPPLQPNGVRWPLDDEESHVDDEEAHVVVDLDNDDLEAEKEEVDLMVNDEHEADEDEEVYRYRRKVTNEEVIFQQQLVDRLTIQAEEAEEVGQIQAAQAFRKSSRQENLKLKSLAVAAEESRQAEREPQILPKIPSFSSTAEHMYVIAYFPGHEHFRPTQSFESLGTLEDQLVLLWPAINACTSVAATRDLLLQRAPAEFYRHGEQILRNKAQALLAQRPVSLEPKRKLDDFMVQPLPLQRGCVLLSGAAGIGKTCFAEAHGAHPYLIRTLDQLKDIPPECDLLVFDDMRFDERGLDLKPEEMLSLLTANRATSIKCRHFDGCIPAIPRIFTTNLDPAGGREQAFPLGANPEQNRALNRRVFKTRYFRTSLYASMLPSCSDELPTETPLTIIEANENKWALDPAQIALW